MKWYRFHFIFIFCLDFCLNGEIQSFSTCSCDPGYTGKYCEIDFRSYSGSGEDLSNDLSSGEETCVNGIPVSISTCLCHFGYTGYSCDSLIEIDVSSSGSGNELDADKEQSGGEYGSARSLDISGEMEPEIEWAATEMDSLPWKHFTNFREQLVDDDGVIDGKFAAVSTGIFKSIHGAKTSLHIAPDVKSLVPNESVLRFTFIPTTEGRKSRLEVTTCFNHVNDILAKYNGIPEEIDLIRKLSCKAIEIPTKLLHTYQYEIYIPRDDIHLESDYILTQWHGSADGTIVRDNSGCLARIPLLDLHKLCQRGFCRQGQIHDHNGEYIGINYMQGGYPPLIFGIKKGYFMITARSDERVFMDKGGCPGKTRTSNCLNYPRQEHSILWKIPANDFKFDQWVRFRWDIKWSEYSTHHREFQSAGIRTSDAWIRVWMNENLIVDWKGGCGRNEPRVPYFKAGIYNPSGNLQTLRFFFRRFSHKSTALNELKDPQIINTVMGLKIKDYKPHDINRNVLTNLKSYRFLQVESASPQKCTLRAEVNYLQQLKKTRFSRLLVDDVTKQTIKHLIHALDEQAGKIQQLEKRIEKCERSSSARSKDDDYYYFEDYGL